MADGKKYLKRRLDEELVIEMEAALLQLLQPFLDQAGIPYEVLETPPEEEGKNQRRREEEGETQRRRR